MAMSFQVLSGMLFMAVLVLIAALRTAKMRSSMLSRSLSSANSVADTLRVQRTNLHAELSAAVKSRDHWKESCADWRKVALQSLADQQKLLRHTAMITVPTLDEDETSDPPSVTENDRRRAEAQRAERDAREAVASRDPRVPPLARAETVGEEDDEEYEG